MGFLTKFKRLKQSAGLSWYKANKKASRFVEHANFRIRARLTPNLRVVIGSSGKFDRGWISSNYQYLNLLDRGHWRRAFGGRRLNALLAEHVWEHLTFDEGLTAARTCYDYLKPGGYLRIAVPDGFHPDANYIAAVRPGGHGDGSDDHRILYNVETLTAMLTAAGFEVRPLEHFARDGTFRQANWSMADGSISRSADADSRNAGGVLVYTSLIVDALKK